MKKYAIKISYGRKKVVYYVSHTGTIMNVSAKRANAFIFANEMHAKSLAKCLPTARTPKIVSFI